MSSIRAMITLLGLVISVTANERRLDAASDGKNQHIADCVGHLITASGYLSSAGMLVASIHRQCSLSDLHCTKEVSLMTNAFGKATAYAVKAASSCGGAKSKCGAAVSQSAAELSKAAASATGFYGAYDPEDLTEQDYRPKVENAQSAARAVGEFLQKSADQISDAVGFCASEDDGKVPDTVIGKCVGLASRAALDLAAAGIQADGAKYDCAGLEADDQKRKCATDVFYTVLDSAKSATRSAGVADMCAKQSSKAKCSAKVTDFVRAMGRIGIVGSSDDLQKKDPGYGGASQLDDLADSLKSASVDVNDAVQVCGADGDTAEPGEGVCVGDSLAGATHTAAAGLSISAAIKDCHLHSTMEEKVHCTTDVMKTMSEFAHASMELMDAAADCGQGKAYSTLCGFHVSHGFHLLGKAATFAAKTVTFADKAAALDKEKPDYDGLAISTHKMGEKLADFAAQMDQASNNCEMVGKPYEAKFDMSSRAHKWLSAGSGQWRPRKQLNVFSSLGSAGICSLAAFVGLTSLFVANKLLKKHGASNRNLGIDMEMLQADDTTDQA